ncbi:MAG: hypothetical protein WBM54_09545, partial [Woeseia sp.]
TLMPYALSAMAELKHSKLQLGPWLIIAIVALVYTLIAMAGAGISNLLWGLLLIVAGFPVFYWSKSRQ